jgi:hypothetical protein
MFWKKCAGHLSRGMIGLIIPIISSLRYLGDIQKALFATPWLYLCDSLMIYTCFCATPWLYCCDNLITQTTFKGLLRGRLRGAYRFKIFIGFY